MKSNYLLIFISIISTHLVSASLNIYLNQNEVKRTLGLAAELYYVRDGTVNSHALQSTIPISPHVEILFITWQSLTGRALPYSISLELSNNLILQQPRFNVSNIGQIPTTPETISIFVPCTGQFAGEVKIFIHFNITFNRASNNITSFHVTRKKICLKADSYNLLANPQLILEPSLNETLSTNIFYIADACAGVLIIITTLFVCCYYMKNKKNLSHHQHIDQDTIPNETNLTGARIAPSHLHQLTFMSTTPIPQNLFTGNCPFAPNSTSSYSSLRRVPAYAVNEVDSKDLEERIATLTLERCRVRLKNVILEGTFGRIYQGTYTNEEGCEENIIIKTVTDHASQTQISLLIQEGMMMNGFSHKNVLSIMGVSVVNYAPPYLIYPYNGYKNLKKFLQKCKLCAEGVARTLTTQEVIDMVLQVVQGMQYLHSKMLKHKDLAARNCVVDDKLRIQITDNALSRDLFPADYHCLGDNENRPIKWLAIESLQYNLFLFQSDVWSFGVLLWEFMTLAQQPYVEIDPFEMEAYLRDGYRLAQPVNCPDELFAVMAYCWALRTEERPSFKQLQVCLQEFYMQLTKYV